MPEVKLVLQAV